MVADADSREDESGDPDKRHEPPGGSSSLPSEAGEESRRGGTGALRSGLRAVRGHEKSHAWPVNIQLPELAGDPTGTGFSPQLH